MLTLVALPAAAQMQIPNPLIRPRSLVNPATVEPAAAEAAAARSQAATPNSSAPIPLPGTPGASIEDAYSRNLTELKDRFANFYVSAIVGKQAMLRRSSASRNGSSAAAAAAGAGLAAVPLAGSATGTQSRSDSLMLADGELFDSVGTTGALVAKITSRQVTIFHVQETMVMPGGKLIGKKAIVFAGDLENSGSSGMPVIVLERQDAAYKRMINVETRSRSASAGTQDAANGNAAGNAASNTPPALLQ